MISTGNLNNARFNRFLSFALNKRIHMRLFGKSKNKLTSMIKNSTKASLRPSKRSLSDIYKLDST
jgi:hypothetical protein